MKSGIGFHLDESVWERLRNELKRITEGEDAVLIIALRLTSTSGERGESEEEHVHLETPFVKSVKSFARRIKEKYRAEPHLHLHSSSGSTTFVLMSPGEILTDNLRSIINEASSCEGCILTSIEGEIRVGEELSALFYGSSAKLHFILPSSDGKRLQLLDVLLTI
ncbi:MAG: hypothetical protein NZ929_06360 [Aigarchaeota archaeon]|nr:hypothetical protein [Aigarchaeota archaeon]MCX8192438.1 hypothetical protein [Nitrososphaeria archaeon]MDW7986644.1 hypothetical protein [Nitrososphaerota archaeon]